MAARTVPPRQGTRGATIGLAACLVAVALAVGGCGGGSDASASSPAPSRSGAPLPSASARGASGTGSALPPPPASVHADELGQIPVLMFHQVVADPRGDYDISPGELRAQLEWLAAQGYVPVTMADVAAGTIDIPAGRSPVVLTFDDSSRSQLKLDTAGNPAPDCAVGILEAVAAAHPGFTATASFYVNGDAFGRPDPAPYLSWLDRHGYEVGDHTQTHADLSALSAAGVQKEIGSVQATIRAALGHGATTMALPYGSEPRPGSLARTGGSGTGTYDFSAVLLVGANAAPSPDSTAWDPGAVPRLRVAHRHVAYDASFWLPKIASTRYVSDGDPAHISFPRAELSRLAAAHRAAARPY